MDIVRAINYNAAQCLQARTGWFWQEREGRPDRGCSSGVEHNLAKVGVVGSNPIARSNFLLQTSMAAQCGTFAPLHLRRGTHAAPSLADVERIAVLQVEMQMGAVDVVGFRAKHRGEHLAGALMHAAEELGLRK